MAFWAVLGMDVVIGILGIAIGVGIDIRATMNAIMVYSIQRERQEER